MANQTSRNGPSRSLRVLACLLGYPDAELRRHLPELRDALHAEQALSRSRLAELDALLDTLTRGSALELEAHYVEVFDRGHATSLHLFEHVHGDSRERGPAMIDLARSYEQAGLYVAPDVLPDHLPVVLEFASTQPPRQARAFLAEFAHIANVIFSALVQRGSAYASVLGAVLELSGEKPQPVPVPEEAPLDAAWQEPLAFDGCSVQGQARPGQAQPLYFVRNGAHAEGAKA